MHSIHLAVLGAVLTFGSCATPYTPRPDRPFEPLTTEFTSGARIALINGQESTAEQNIGGSFIADYHAWTDVAIQIAARELELRGLTIEPSADRTLSLAVTEARYRTGWVKISTEIDMEVVTGDGYSAKYTSRNSSVMAAVPKRQIDGAMMRVVVELLKDPEIVRYLGQ